MFDVITKKLKMENTSMEILPGENFLGITLIDKKKSISIEIEDVDQLKTIKKAVDLVLKNLKTNP
jgi:hypothetical protein